VFTLTLPTGPVNGTTNAAGLATFSTLTTTVAGTYTITAAAGGQQGVQRVHHFGGGGEQGFLRHAAQQHHCEHGAQCGHRAGGRYLTANAIVGSNVVMTASGGVLGGTLTVATNASGDAVFNNLTQSVPAPIP